LVRRFWKQHVIFDLAWFSFLHILLNAKGILVGLKGEGAGFQRGGSPFLLSMLVFYADWIGSVPPCRFCPWCAARLSTPTKVIPYHAMLVSSARAASASTALPWHLTARSPRFLKSYRSKSLALLQRAFTITGTLFKMDLQQQDSQQQDPQQQNSQQQDSQQQDSQQQDSQQQDSQQQDPVYRIEPLDADEVPPEYQGDRVASSRDRQSNKVGRNDTRRPSIPKPPSRGATRRDAGRKARRPAPPNDSPSFASRLTGMLPTWSPKRAFTRGGSARHEQDEHRRQHNTEYPEEEFRGVDGTSEQMLMYENDIMEGQQSFWEALEVKEHEWEERERQFQRHISLITRHFEESSHNLQAKLRESESEKLVMREEHNAFIRKQQEASFGQMESARWLPMDEGKVMHALDRLKTDMRSWAKATSFKDSSRLRSFAEAESAAFMQDLAKVALVKNGQLPDGLSTIARSPMLLLNALLAHSVYTSLFRSPFFFLGSNDPNGVSNARPERILEDIYERAQEGKSHLLIPNCLSLTALGNQQDAHIWRSQTLRLLMPPLRNDATHADADAEKQLRFKTEDLIVQAAGRQASAFLASPARYLIEDNADTVLTNKLNKIYSDAAKLSYTLWTRRTQMRCFTLHEIKHLAFDHESPDFDPDNLVRFEDHEDLLKDKTVTVIVHPLLKVYGTDEAKDYDQGRVWAKGVVWLDSKKSPV